VAVSGESSRMGSKSAGNSARNVASNASFETGFMKTLVTPANLILVWSASEAGQVPFLVETVE